MTHSCMLAETYKGWPAGWTEAWVQPKYDGFRLTVKFDAKGERTYYCRKSTPVEWAQNLEHIDQDLAQLGLKDCLLDGELVGKNWNQLQSLVTRKPENLSPEQRDRIKQDVKLAVFDLVFLGCEHYSLRERTQRLYQLSYFSWPEHLRTTPVNLCKSHEEVMAYYLSYVRWGYEGLMVKHPDSPYECKRSKFWLKLKPMRTEERAIVAVVEGKGKRQGMVGKLVLEGDVCAGPGKGMNDARLKEMWADRENLVGKLAEIEVQDSDVAKARHPRFIRIREDLA